MSIEREMYERYKLYLSGNAYIPLQDLVAYEKAYHKVSTWLKQYNELYNHCKDCPNYHVQSHENLNDVIQTTHRCKAMCSDYRDEYSRGYYPILDIGMKCPLNGEQISSLTISETMKIAFNWVKKP